MQPLQVFCLVTLIASASTIAAVNKVEDFSRVEYEDGDRYKAVAVWLVFVATLAIIYHAVMIPVNIRIFYVISTIGRNTNEVYATIVSYMYMYNT